MSKLRELVQESRIVIEGETNLDGLLKEVTTMLRTVTDWVHGNGDLVSKEKVRDSFEPSTVKIHLREFQKTGERAAANLQGMKNNLQTIIALMNKG